MNARALFVRDDGALRAPWRITFFLGATSVAALLVGGLLYPAVAFTGVIPLARQWGVPLDQLGALVALVAGTWATLSIADGAGGDGARAGRRGAWASVGMGRDALRWRALAVGLAAGTLAILLPSALLLATGQFALEPHPPEGHTWAGAARAALFVLVPAALVEEIAMRGYLLTALRDALRAPGAVAVTSILFAALHLFNPGPTLVSTSVVALAGVFLGVVRLATGSLYAAWLAHLAWNFVQAVVLHAPVSGLPVPTPGYRLADHGPAWLTGGAWGPEGGVAAAVGMLLTTILLLRHQTSDVRRPMSDERMTSTPVDSKR